jgi:hypothetical protein
MTFLQEYETTLELWEKFSGHVLSCLKACNEGRSAAAKRYYYEAEVRYRELGERFKFLRYLQQSPKELVLANFINASRDSLMSQLMNAFRPYLAQLHLDALE